MPVQVGRTGEENNGILRVDRVYMLTNFKNKYIGDRAFYKRYMYLALPMILQNAITNLVSFLDNIMVGQLGTEQMSGVAIVNQLILYTTLQFLARFPRQVFLVHSISEKEITKVICIHSGLSCTRYFL